MGKTFTRNPNDENYRGNMRGVRKANKANRQDRHRQDQVMEGHMEPDDEGYGEHSDNFRQRRDDW